eukprot:TRINITY_DN11081_c0_g1_i1.p2 TRINITY_DN11081_c0_g1~~TRINITY_DN11081_c0_g1_i1.p2  ORF type:complete len:213 (+),score=36.36 TRINITY_DN11081_c0_g1_i1:26-640(+)
MSDASTLARILTRQGFDNLTASSLTLPGPGVLCLLEWSVRRLAPILLPECPSDGYPSGSGDTDAAQRWLRASELLGAMSVRVPPVAGPGPLPSEVLGHLALLLEAAEDVKNADDLEEHYKKDTDLLAAIEERAGAIFSTQILSADAQPPSNPTAAAQSSTATAAAGGPPPKRLRVETRRCPLGPPLWRPKWPRCGRRSRSCAPM